MSRYVEVALALRDLDEVASALASLGLVVERATEGLMLRGGLECTGAPVELRVAAGPFDTIEDFGLARRSDGTLVLVCGELDRGRLDAALVPALATAIASLRLAAAGDLQVIATETGTRVVVRRR
ncbi:MAG TPA: hypothetical protein VFG69_02570 [Nannocystaceae bacterium]|nr:hypothetical protein [Nannocystaceae bacterium]